MSKKINTTQTGHIRTIVGEPLNRLRIEFSHVFMESKVSQSYFEQLLPRIKENFSDKQLYDKHLENLKSVLSTGDIKFPINLSLEESQFFWGTVLAYISSNPEIQQRWDQKNQFTKISESTLWKRIAHSSEMRKEFKATAFILRNSLRNPETRMLWGEPLGSGYPNIGYCFIPEENIIVDDMLWSLVGGTKNALPAINHEIAHSQGTIGIPQKIHDLEQQFQNIRQQIAEAEQTHQNTEEIQKLVVQAMALQQEAKLRFYIYNELENMYANRYAINAGGDADKLSLNILETCICGTGEQYLSEVKSLEDFKKELTPSKRINHIKRAVRYSFFCNNGLIRNTLEDWHSIGVYPECIVAYDKDGRELPWQDSFEKLRDICNQLEKLQPSKILRLLNQSKYTKQMKEMSQKRQELSMEFFDSFVLPYVKDLIKENVQDTDQQSSEQTTLEDLQKLQQQMQNVMQEVIRQNTLRELSNTSQPQNDDEQNEDQQSGSDGQQSDAEQNQSEQQSGSDDQQNDAKQNQSEQQSGSDGQQNDAEQNQSEQQSGSDDQQSDAEQNQSEQQSGSDGQQSDAEQNQSEQQSGSGGQQSDTEQNQSEQQSGSGGQQSDTEQNQSEQQSGSGGQQSDTEQNQSEQQSGSGGQQNDAEQNQSEQQSGSDGQQSDTEQNQSEQQNGSGGQQSDEKQHQSQRQSTSDQQDTDSLSLSPEEAKHADKSEIVKDDSQIDNQDETLKANSNIDFDALPPSENQMSHNQQHSMDEEDKQTNAQDNPENKDEEENNNHQDSPEPDKIKDILKKQSEEKERDLEDISKQFDSIEGDLNSEQDDEAKKTDRLKKLLDTKHQNESTSKRTQNHNTANSPQPGNTHQISLDEENGQHTDNSQTQGRDGQLSSTDSDIETQTSGYKTNKTSDVTTGKEKRLGKTGRSNSVSDMLGGMDFPKSRGSVTISKQELQELIKASENIDNLALEDFRDKTEAVTPQDQTTEDYEEIDDNWGEDHQGDYHTRPTLISRSEMHHSSGDDARLYAKGDLNSYEKIIADHEVTILKVRHLLKKIIEQQKMEQAKKSLSHKKEDKMELLPTQGADKLSIPHQIDLIKKQRLRDPSLSIKDFERFKNKKQKPKMLSAQDVDVPSVDVGILIDGSGSMDGAPFETALTLGCILFEASRKIPEINIYIYMMGQPRPLVIGLPENSQEEIACNLDSVRRGQGGCNDHLTPAVERFLQDVAERKAKDPKSKSGFQHIFSITDGGNNDYEERDVNKILETLLDNNPYMTFDSFFIDVGYTNYTKGFILEKRQAGCKRIGFVDNIYDISEMPQKICEMLTQRMKYSKLDKASTNMLLTKIIKDSLSKI